ncbi:MAG: hypothetical protein ABI239_13820 [Aquihabitans sp.]
MLLYVNAVMSLIVILNIGFGGSGYMFLPLALWRSSVDISNLTNSYGVISLVAGLVYGFAGLGIANGEKLGWKVGVGVAAGAVILPILAVGPGIITSGYIISFIFDSALLVALLHPQSRIHQQRWFS